MTVTYDGTTLTQGTDYSVEYSDNTNAGTATATIQGSGDYSGTVVKEFTINKATRSSGQTLSLNYGQTSSTLSIGGNTITSGNCYSANTSVATIANGKITATGVGTTTVYYYIGDKSISGYENYDYLSYTVTVSKADQTVYGVGNVTVTYTGTAQLATPQTTATDSVTYTYSSNKTSVATVSSSGLVTAKGVGEATITITASSTTNYNSGSMSIKVTVTQLGQTLSLSTQGSTNIYVGGTSTWKVTSSGDGTVVYSTSDSSIATVSSSGVVTGLKPGIVTLYVEANSSTNYSAASKTAIASIAVAPGATSSLSVANDSSGVKITWAKVDGVTGYLVQRSTSSNGTYSNIAQITSASTVMYTDTNVSSGTTYYYKIAAYYTASAGTLLGQASSAKGITYVAKASVSSVANASSGVTVSWSKVTGAAGYYVYRGSTLVKTITSGSTLSYTDTGVSSGTTYTYYVTAYSGSTSGAKSDGASIKYLAKGTVSKVANTSTGVKVTWKKVSGAGGYYIYRGDTLVKTVTSGSTTSWTDTGVTSGKSYKYYVTAYSGSTTGVKSDAKSARYVARATISSVENVSKGVKVTWGKVTGAKGYYVYRGSTKVATIKKNSTVTYTDTAVKSKNGTSYTYYVVAYYNSTWKAVKSAGAKTVRLTAVSISSLKNSSSKAMTVKYKKNSKATGYQIQYSTSKKFTTKTTKTVTVSKNSKVTQKITKLTKNKTYYVRVRAYKTKSGVKYYSAYSSTKTVKIKK